jgi:hypothetical protein
VKCREIKYPPFFFSVFFFKFLALFFCSWICSAHTPWNHERMQKCTSRDDE